MNSACELFHQARQDMGLSGIAANLGLDVNTLKRWDEQDKVPSLYYRDLARILGQREYAKGNERDKDQFFTKTSVARECIERFKKVAKTLGVDLSKYKFIEPAAGAGAFYNFLPKQRRLGLDIDPKGIEIKKRDYLTWKPTLGKKYIVIGNPPFGLRGHLALQFINHSYVFADMVAFILPPLFNSDGKGVPAKRVKGYKLAHTSGLGAKSFIYPDGSSVGVEAIFQVWTKINQHKIKIKKPKTCKSWIRVYSLSDGGTPASTRNKKMLYKCHVYLPSTCFNGMKIYSNFEKLPHRRGYGIFIHKEVAKIKNIFKNSDWQKISFRSTNGALNLRTSLIESALIKAGYVDT